MTTTTGILIEPDALARLADALAALGRELAAAEELRDLDAERRAQDRWRAAVASYEGR